MAKEFHYTWEYQLQSSPAALWPLVSDTNRFNRDTGLPPIVLLGIENGVRRVKFKIPIVNVQWDEEPFEWIYPTRFGVARRYHTGPLKEMRVDCRMEEKPEGGTKMVYDVVVVSRNILGDLAVPVVIGAYSGKMFHDTFHAYDRIVARGGSILTISKGRRLSAGSHAKYKTLNDTLAKQGVSQQILDRLYEFIHRADDISIQRMRPYALADLWGIPRRQVLEAFLRATRVGLLDMYWDILCPQCSSRTENFAALDEVEAHSHCSSCKIDFTASFDHNIEVIFRTNPSIRDVDATVEFCVGSPQRQPEILFNITVPPREEIPISTALQPGRYHISTGELNGHQIVSATESGREEVRIYGTQKGWPAGIETISLQPRLRLINETDQAQTFGMVRAQWSDQAATGADVTSLQTFRDLFSNEVLRPGEEISVGSITLMFTDLRNSTKMYREIGDAPAFGRVREHFEILEQAVAAEGGAIVKTMGDAIMAAFRKPISAVRAIWDVQNQLSAQGEPALSIKVGIHFGPCIVVNLNDRLDYFGSTVNITARLPHFSEGGELIVSEQIRNDVEVNEFLEKNAKINAISRFRGDIRGYDQVMDLWRIRM